MIQNSVSFMFQSVTAALKCVIEAMRDCYVPVTNHLFENQQVIE